MGDPNTYQGAQRYTQRLPKELTLLLAEYVDPIVLQRLEDIEEMRSSFRHVLSTAYDDDYIDLRIAACKYAITNNMPDEVRRLYCGLPLRSKFKVTQYLRGLHTNSVDPEVVDDIKSKSLGSDHSWGPHPFTVIRRHEVEINVSGNGYVGIDDYTDAILPIEKLNIEDLGELFFIDDICECCQLYDKDIPGLVYDEHRYVYCSQCNSIYTDTQDLESKVGISYEFIIYYKDKFFNGIIDRSRLDEDLVTLIEDNITMQRR
jgi:hypothetical protein